MLYRIGMKVVKFLMNQIQWYAEASNGARSMRAHFMNVRIFEHKNKKKAVLLATSLNLILDSQ
jgi:hypothetical protein